MYGIICDIMVDDVMGYARMRSQWDNQPGWAYPERSPMPCLYSFPVGSAPQKAGTITRTPTQAGSWAATTSGNTRVWIVARCRTMEGPAFPERVLCRGVEQLVAQKVHGFPNAIYRVWGPCLEVAGSIPAPAIGLLTRDTSRMGARRCRLPMAAAVASSVSNRSCLFDKFIE